MPSLRFKAVSHSWVALHPQPKGVVQFVGGAFFGTFAPMIFYRHLLSYFFDKSFTIIILPFNFSFNHYRESFFLIREQYALLPELIAMAIAEGSDPTVYLAANNFFWVGHSIGCKYIALLESAGKLPKCESDLKEFIAEVIEPMQLGKAGKLKLVNRLASELISLREGLMADAITSKSLAAKCEVNNQSVLGQVASAPKNIYNDLFIRDQNSILLAPVTSDTSSAVRPKILAKWIDNLGWGVQPTSEVTKNLIKKSDLFNLLILAKFKSDKLASETVQWFYNTLNRPDASDREPFPGGHLRPLGFNLADLVVNPWFDLPFITSMASRNHALEDRLDQQLQKLQSKSAESQAQS